MITYTYVIVMPLVASFICKNRANFAMTEKTISFEKLFRRVTSIMTRILLNSQQVANIAYVITGLIAGSCPRYRRIDGGTRGASVEKNGGKGRHGGMNKSTPPVEERC